MCYYCHKLGCNPRASTHSTKNCKVCKKCFSHHGGEGLNLGALPHLGENCTGQVAPSRARSYHSSSDTVRKYCGRCRRSTQHFLHANSGAERLTLRCLQCA